ncbi:MAG: lysostaphin resistance A-like protein [Flammeovirgaceae bacterium]
MDSQTAQFRAQGPQPSPVVLMLFLMMFCIGGLLIGQFVMYIIGQAFGIDLTQMGTLYDDPANRVPLLLSQLGYSVLLFIVAPYIFLRYFDADLLTGKVVGNHGVPLNLVLLSAFILFAFFPASGYFVGLNKGMALPESMAGFEQTLQNLEATAAELTNFIVSFDSTGEFLLGLLVIAVIPAIGEEFLFRGILQTYFGRMFKNVHLAIWVTAFIFSAFHLQFYGLLPRMLLGALFGYLFAYSGRLIYAMIAHFINNGFTLLLVYLYQKGTISTNIEETEALPFYVAAISMAVVIVLLIRFKKDATASLMKEEQ